MVEERTSAIQRVRIGLTGLAFVFLAVLLAAAFTRAPQAEAPITANTVTGAAGDPARNDAESLPKEPLAELGVAPGNAESNVSNQAGAPPQ